MYISERFQNLRNWQILLILVGLSAFIRFFGLEYSSLWLDEIYSMNGSNPESTLLEVYNYGKNDQPPVFFIILHLWLKIFGYTDFAGRSLSCLYGVFGVVAIYFLGKEVKNEKLGLFAAFITTISWFHTDYSKEIRFYALVFLLSTLSFFFLFRSIKNQHIKDFGWYALFTGLLINTHYYGMATYLSQIVIFIVVLLFFKYSTRLLIGGLVAGGIAGLTFVHWLPVIFSELGVGSHYLAPLKWDFLFDLYWSYIKEPTALAIYTFCLGLGVIEFIRRIKSRSLNYTPVIFVIWIMISIGLPIIYSVIKVPIFTSKYTSTIVPAVFILIAYGFTKIQNQKIIVTLISLVSIGAIVILFFARPPYKPRRGEDWREVAVYFKEHKKENQVILSNLWWFHQYYFKKFELEIPVSKNEINFTELANRNNSIWILNNDYYSPNESTSLNDEQKSLLQKDFIKGDSIRFKQTSAVNYLRK